MGGECCSKCKKTSCGNLADGDTKADTADPCITRSCDKGEIQVSKQECPEPQACGSGQITKKETPQGQCCPTFTCEDEPDKCKNTQCAACDKGFSPGVGVGSDGCCPECVASPCTYNNDKIKSGEQNAYDHQDGSL